MHEPWRDTITVTKFTRLFYVFQFFFEFILIWAVDKLFFLYRGLELYHIAILLACWSGFSILLEVPTGALADKWNRKNMLALSGIFCLLCFISWFFSSSFCSFLLGFFFLTVYGAFVSGTLQAYVYDFLKLNSRLHACQTQLWNLLGALRIK